MVFLSSLVILSYVYIDKFELYCWPVDDAPVYPNLPSVLWREVGHAAGEEVQRWVSDMCGLPISQAASSLKALQGHSVQVTRPPPPH